MKLIKILSILLIILLGLMFFANKLVNDLLAFAP